MSERGPALANRFEQVSEALAAEVEHVLPNQ
jgi:hypothetical protein